VPELYNRTPGCVELIPLIDRYGSNVLVVICKVTYEIHDGHYLQISADQEPIAFADVATGDVLNQASDATDYKPSTDVIVLPPREDHDIRRHEDVLDLQIGESRFGGPMTHPWRFGPISRIQSPRKEYAGTYDRAWFEQRFPLLPLDFDPRHNQAAPPDQVTPRHLIGDEHLWIRNLYRPEEVIHAALTGKTTVVAGNVRGHYFADVAILDTVTIRSDRPIASLVWRRAIKPRQKIEEVRNVFVSMAFLRSTREVLGKP